MPKTMQVQYMKAEAVSALKNAVKRDELPLQDTYQKDSNDWLKDFFAKQGIQQPFGVFKTPFEEFDLRYDANGDKGKSDVLAVKTLYSAMKELKDSDASDERLWAGMCHTRFYDYVRKRWDFDNSPKYILSRFFYGQSVHRSEMTNTLAKLWWVGRLTYDESGATEEERFRYTEYLADTLIGTARLPLFSNNFTANPKILRGVLKALMKLEDEGYDLSDKKAALVKATNYLNVQGGTSILDIWDEDEICAKVVGYMRTQ